MDEMSLCQVCRRRTAESALTMAVMIVSYETLRTLQDELANCPIGLLLADEGHRLKNAGWSSLPADDA